MEIREKVRRKRKGGVAIEMLRDNAPLSLIEKYAQVSAEKIAEIARSIGAAPVT